LQAVYGASTYRGSGGWNGRIMSSGNFQLHRDPYGRLVLTTASGAQHIGVVPVRAFPISAPDQGLSLLSADGHELLWVDHLSELPETVRTLLDDELAAREFVPEIERIIDVSSFVCPCTWRVLTDRGPAELRLKGEEDIRRLSDSRLLI